MAYAERIAEIVPGYNPRHIEAFMRAWHGTLDALSPQQFVAEAALAAEDVRAEGEVFAESLAKALGI